MEQLVCSLIKQRKGDNTISVDVFKPRNTSGEPAVQTAADYLINMLARYPVSVQYGDNEQIHRRVVDGEGRLVAELFFHPNEQKSLWNRGHLELIVYSEFPELRGSRFNPKNILSIVKGHGLFGLNTAPYERVTSEYAALFRQQR